MFNEFKKFAMQGNVVDLAVGVVIGAAFGQITNTLSTNILTPFVGLLLGGYDFSKLSIPLAGNAVVGYGLFLQALLNFVLIAFALFLMVKAINRLTRKKKQEEQAAKPVETEEVRVLREILGELKKEHI
jgi:large conductance mechanosensitive channel